MFATVGAELAMQIGVPVDDAAVWVVSHVALLPEGLLGVISHPALRLTVAT